MLELLETFVANFYFPLSKIYNIEDTCSNYIHSYSSLFLQLSNELPSAKINRVLFKCCLIEAWKQVFFDYFPWKFNGVFLADESGRIGGTALLEPLSGLGIKVDTFIARVEGGAVADFPIFKVES